MDDGRRRRRRFGDRLAVQPGLQDALDTAITQGAAAKGPGAGRLEPLGRVSFPQPQDAQAAAEALLGVPAGLQDGRDERLGHRPRFRGPGHDPRRRPLEISPMGLGHVGRLGGVGAPLGVSRVRGHAAALEEDLHRVHRDPELHRLLDQLVGNTVVMARQFDVVVDVDPGLLPFGVLVGPLRQGPEGGAVKVLEEASACAFELLEGLLVELGEFFGDGGIELVEAEEAAMAKRGHDPALRHLDGFFHLGLVPGVAAPGGDDDRAVVSRHVAVGGIELGFVAASLRDGRLEIVGNGELGNPAEEGEGMPVRIDPIRQALACRGPAEGVVAGPQDGHEELGRAFLPRLRVDNRHRQARVVHQELLPGPVALAKADIQMARPLMVQQTELAVLVALGIGRLVLQPQKPQGHALAAQLPVDLCHVGKGACLRSDRRLRREQQPIKRRVVEIGGKRPGEARRSGALQILPDGAPGDSAARGDLLMGQLLLPFESQDFSNGSHGQPLCRHRFLLGGFSGGCTGFPEIYPASPSSSRRVAESIGIGWRLPSESGGGINRNQVADCVGIRSYY